MEAENTPRVHVERLETGRFLLSAESAVLGRISLTVGQARTPLLSGVLQALAGVPHPIKSKSLNSDLTRMGTPMTKSEAQATANEYIKLILQHQENALGMKPLQSPDNAEKAAQALAAFRKELIAQLSAQ